MQSVKPCSDVYIRLSINGRKIFLNKWKLHQTKRIFTGQHLQWWVTELTCRIPWTCCWCISIWICYAKCLPLFHAVTFQNKMLCAEFDLLANTFTCIWLNNLTECDHVLSWLYCQIFHLSHVLQVATMICSWIKHVRTIDKCVVFLRKWLSSDSKRLFQ